MMTGFNDKNELKNVRVTNEGAIKVDMQGIQTSEDGAIKVKDSNINTTETGNLKVSIEENNVQSETETILKGELLTVGIEATVVEINKKVTEIEIANYSETAQITLTIGTLTFTFGKNIATSFPVNKEIENISIVSTEADTQVQIIIRGVE